MQDTLLPILLSLTIAYALSVLGRKIGIPRVISQITTGLILGYPLFRNLVFTDGVMPILSFIADIGIILLFFFVGLEINFSKFKHGFSTAAYVAFFDTIVPFAAGFAVSYWIFHLSGVISMIIGISLSVCAEAIAIDILEESRLLRTKMANLIISAATLDDIPEFILLGLAVILFGNRLQQGTVSSFIGGLMLFLGLIIFFRLAVIPLILKLVERDKSSASLFTGALIIVFFMASLSNFVGITSLLGALVAGMLVRQTLLTGKKKKPWEEHEIAKTIHTIAFGFMIPVFFVYVGLNTHILDIGSNIPLLGAMVLICVAGTIVGTIIAILISHGTLKEGFLLGWAFIPKGDTELVIATIALKNGLLNSEIYSVIVACAMICTLVATIVFRHLIAGKKIPLG